jgi:hypothetical protein
MLTINNDYKLNSLLNGINYVREINLVRAQSLNNN